MAKKAKVKAKKATKASNKKPAKKQTKKLGKPASKNASGGNARFVENALDHSRFAHKMIHDFAKGINDSMALAQPAGNKNHLIWTYGHLADTYDWFAESLGSIDAKCPMTYKELFGGGSKPTGDASKYPTLAQVRADYDKAGERMLKAIASCKDFFVAPEKDSGGWMSNKMQAVDRCAWHVGWHLGQLANLRRELGLPKAMGG